MCRYLILYRSVNECWNPGNVYDRIVNDKLSTNKSVVMYDESRFRNE